MKNIAAFLCCIVVHSAVLQATELAETGFPAKLPETINLGGATRKSDECLQPWVAANPAEYAGQYVSKSITDGRAHLILRLHKGQDSEGDLRWHVDGGLETSVGVGLPHIILFKNAELREPKQPCFDVLERLMPALFVLFTPPASEDATPIRGVVMGHNLYLIEGSP